MNDTQVFSNSEFGKLEVLIINGREMFPATECARVLGYRDPNSAIRNHCKEDGWVKHLGVSQTVNQHGVVTEQTVEKTYISEGNLYRLIIRSKLPSAEKFERWIFDEVLPSIRKHGIYMTEEKFQEVMCDPDAWIKVLTALKNERSAKEQLQAKIDQDKPKVLFAETVSVSDTTILIGELAKILKGNGISIGQNRMFEWMRKNGYLIKRKGTDYNAPTQMAMELGLFKVKETSITCADGHVNICKTTKVTGKGQQYFISRFMEDYQKDESSKISDTLVLVH